MLFVRQQETHHLSKKILLQQLPKVKLFGSLF